MDEAREPAEILGLVDEGPPSNPLAKLLAAIKRGPFVLPPPVGPVRGFSRREEPRHRRRGGKRR